MDEFEEFSIRSFRNRTEVAKDRMCHVHRNANHLPNDVQSFGCADVTEIFPSPVDICEVRKAWYGDEPPCLSEDLASDGGVQLCPSDDTAVPRQGHGSSRTGPKDNAQRTKLNRISRSRITDSETCLHRSVSAEEKVSGPCRNVVGAEGIITRITSGGANTSKLTSVGSLTTSLLSSSSSSSLSSAASVADDGQSASRATDEPKVKLEQAVYRVRSFSTDNGSVLNLGDSFKVFNKLLLLGREDNSSNTCAEQPPVHQTTLRQSKALSGTSSTHRAEESEDTVSASAKGSASTKSSASTRTVPTRSPASRTACKRASRNTRLLRFGSSAAIRDTEFSDAETGDANDELRELLKHDDEGNSSDDDEEGEWEEGEGYELLRKIAFPAIPSPEELKKRSSSVASIALRSLVCEGNGKGSLHPTDGAYLPREGDGDGQWAGDNLLRVKLIGSQGVGKTTLTQQLMTSEYSPADLLTSSDRCCDCSRDNIVVIQVDDVQSVLQFIETSGEVVDACGSGCGLGAAEVDLYLVVYSVTDRSSFKYAGAFLRQLSRRFPPSMSPAAAHHPVAILVANKQDLVRKRVVSENSGKRLALKRHCKFIEISAFLDHRVDELLVGILKQLQLQQLRQCALEDGEDDEDDDDDLRNSADAGCLRNVGFLRFWRRLSWQYCSHAHQPSSCDDLFA